MIGSVPNMARRLRSLLPTSWFPATPIPALLSNGDTALLQNGGVLSISTPGPPVLVALLQAPASALAWAYALLAFVRLQTRILTSSGGWLDLTAYDFFGDTFSRTTGQSDSAFAAAIIAQIFLIRNTRQALINVLTTLTGSAPVVFEPWRIPDCAALKETLFYGVAGLRGSRTLTFTVFVTVTHGSATNAQIYAAIESVRSAGITIWVQIL